MRGGNALSMCRLSEALTLQQSLEDQLLGKGAHVQDLETKLQHAQHELEAAETAKQRATEAAAAATAELNTARGDLAQAQLEKSELDEEIRSLQASSHGMDSVQMKSVLSWLITCAGSALTLLLQVVRSGDCASIIRRTVDKQQR